MSNERHDDPDGIYLGPADDVKMPETAPGANGSSSRSTTDGHTPYIHTVDEWTDNQSAELVEADTGDILNYKQRTFIFEGSNNTFNITFVENEV